MFNEESYRKHVQWKENKFPKDDDKRAFYKKNSSAPLNNIDKWMHRLRYNCINPSLKEPNTWLTVGDAYGYDAQFILSLGNQKAHASDIDGTFLEVAKTEGIITESSAQNAECLSFPDQSFDYVLCKDAYHHFPRPYAALYEMIRVAKKGIVIIEPQDPVLKMPLLLGLTNILSKVAPNALKRIWKNVYSFEEVGNFVYKISEREIEKFAAALCLPLVAFKKLNTNFYYKGADQGKTKFNDANFRRIWLKKKILDLLSKLGLLPSQELGVIVFKALSSESLMNSLKQDGYKLINIPKNPYATS